MRLRNYRSPINKAVRRAARETLQYAIGQISDKTPVRTGALKRNWSGHEINNRLYAANKQHYAAYVEYGTSRFVGRRMVSRSIPAIKKFYSDKVTSYVISSIWGS
jgi:hypothetical protein